MDFMSDFCYGGLFDFTVRDADHLNVHQFSQGGLKITEVCRTIPWVRPILQVPPNPAFDNWFAMSMRVVKNRKDRGSAVARDLAYYLVRLLEHAQCYWVQMIGR